MHGSISSSSFPVLFACAGHCTGFRLSDALAVGRQTVEGMSRMILWNGGALLAQTLVDAPSMALFQKLNKAMPARIITQWGRAGLSFDFWFMPWLRRVSRSVRVVR